MLEQLLERWPVSLPHTLAAACVLALLAALGSQVAGWREVLHAPLAPAAVAAGDSADAPPESPLPLVLSADLFGSGAGSAPVTSTLRTSQGYTLRAVFAATGGKAAGAVIEPTGGEAQWVPLEGTLPGGVRLREVHPDHVILDRGGAPESLAFPPIESALLAAGQGPAGDGPTTTSQSAPIPADVSAEEKAQLIRQRLEELRNRART